MEHLLIWCIALILVGGFGTRLRPLVRFPPPINMEPKHSRGYLELRQCIQRLINQ
jgi:hypothetical protein